MKNPTNYAAKLERFKLLVKSVDSLRTELEELAGRVIDADRGAWYLVKSVIGRPLRQANLII